MAGKQGLINFVSVPKAIGAGVAAGLLPWFYYAVADGRTMFVFYVLPALPFLILAFTAASPLAFYPGIFLAQFTASMALGGAAATTQDLVLPRMRGTATATFFLGTTLLGLAMGPYLAGRVSTLSGSLSVGMLSLLLITPVTVAAGIAAWRLVPAAEATREARAREAGEAI